MLIRILLPVFLITCVRASNILLLPLPTTSHCLENVAVGSELANRGHNVTLLVVSTIDTTRCMGDAKIDLLVHQANSEMVALRENMNNFMTGIFRGEYNFLKSISQVTLLITNICHSYLSDETLIKQISEARFDIAIVDGFPFGRCLFALPYSLGIPTVSVSSVHDDFHCMQPFQGNTLPHFISNFSNEMSLLERLQNAMFTLMIPAFKMFFIPKFDLQTYGSVFGNHDDDQIFKASILHLENTDHIVDFPKATFPNFVQVGGLTTLPSKPLPLELKTYFDNSEHGVILVSFGDSIKGAPKQFIEKLTSAFRKLKENVLVKLDHDEEIGNVRIVKWLPQRDVLGHPKTKLLISHCGKNTFYESLYNGVPILCTPLHGDNFGIAKRVSHFRVGISLNIIRATEDDLVESVNHVLNDQSYAVNMKRASVMFRDRRETPRQRAASAVEHVLKYGGEHLKPGQADLNFFQYLYGDIWLVIFAVLATIIYVCVKFMMFVCCRKKTASSQKIKTH